MLKPLLFSMSVILCVSSLVSAQTSTQTVAECLTAVQNYSDRQEEIDRKAGVKPNYRAYTKQAKELARTCGARFNLYKINSSELPTLARLYFEGDQDALARAAIERRLKSTKLTETERAEALTISIRVVTKSSVTPANLKLAEKQTKELDAMSEAVLKQKIDAHKRMSAYYSGNDVEEEKVLEHSELVLKLVKVTMGADRETYARQNLSLYSRIGVAYANRGMTEKALEVFREGHNEALRQGRTLPDGSTDYENPIQRYSMLGQPAPALTGAYWINSDPETKQLELKSKVTLIQFTAHWCAPCRASYPDILKLYRQNKPRGFEVVMSTQIFGYFADRASLKPDEEVEADRDYYSGKHQLPFTIAVDPFVDNADKSAAATEMRRQGNYARYFAGGYPQTYVLDRKGVVRLIVFGWSQDNQARTVKLIDELLSEAK